MLTTVRQEDARQLYSHILDAKLHRAAEDQDAERPRGLARLGASSGPAISKGNVG